MAYNITAGRQGININDKHVDKNGYLKIDDYELPIAGENKLGGVKVGERLTVAEDGTLSADVQTLPIAGAETLGGVKIGEGVNVAEDGTISVSGGQSIPIITYRWSTIDKTAAELLELYNNKQPLILKYIDDYDTEFYFLNNYYLTSSNATYHMVALSTYANLTTQLRLIELTFKINGDTVTNISLNRSTITIPTNS